MWGIFDIPKLTFSSKKPFPEGIIDHQILGIHHVNETVPPDQWIYWDMVFLCGSLDAGRRLALAAGRKARDCCPVGYGQINSVFVLVFSFGRHSRLITILTLVR
jgi:hypothetical protein